MSAEDEFKILIGGYFGIQEMDEYKLKEYVLQDIETHIKSFLQLHPLNGSKDLVKHVQENVPLLRKLQDSLLVMRKINGHFDLILLIKRKIEKLKEK